MIYIHTAHYINVNCIFDVGNLRSSRKENWIYSCCHHTLLLAVKSGNTCHLYGEEGGFWLWPCGGMLMLHVSTSALHQSGGSSPTVPDDWAVADLLNHSTHCVEMWFRHSSVFDQSLSALFIYLFICCDWCRSAVWASVVSPAWGRVDQKANSSSVKLW